MIFETMFIKKKLFSILNNIGNTANIYDIKNKKK